MENSPDSPYHEFFGIRWNPLYEKIRGRVLPPFLSKFYGDCLKSGELQFAIARKILPSATTSSMSVDGFRR